MMKEKWFDRNGVELHDGDIIVDVDSGKEERVYACHPDGYPEYSCLGINASNEKFLENHPEYAREIYPFSNFANVPYGDGRKLMFYEKVVK